MALHNGIDTIAVISFGVFSKNYGSADGGNIASLFASRGLLEDAPAPPLFTGNFFSIIRRGLRQFFTQWK